MILLSRSSSASQVGRAESPVLPPSSDITRRVFRPGNFITETLVKGVAFLSLSFIFLIFIFVFREALPLFTSKTTATEAAATPVGESESYGDPAPEKSESYGDLPTDTEIKPTAPTPSTVESQPKRTPLEMLAENDWQPVSDHPKYGLLPLIWGSFKVTFIALLLAGPIGILAALFSVAFAGKGLREVIKPVVELLAGVPSVVVGFFILMIVASALQHFTGATYRMNALLGGIALAIAVVPIIFTVTEDALSAVPRSLTEAGLALGASRWQTAFFIVLPAAVPGVLAALILGFGRAFGETMIVLMATGNAALASISLIEPVRTMSATIGAEMAEVVFGESHYQVLFFIGTALFAVTFCLNALTEFFVRGRLLKKITGGAR